MKFKQIALAFFAAGFCHANAADIEIGFNAHLLNHSKLDFLRSLDELVKLKIKYVRIDFPWKVIEKTPNSYEIPIEWQRRIDRILSMGLEPIIILDYGNVYYDNGDKPKSKLAIRAFSNYASYVAASLGAKVTYYQVWNEWDGTTGKTRPADTSSYINLIRATYPKIKAENPAAQVIGSAFSSAAFNFSLGIDKRNFLPEYLESNIAAQYTDIISIHPYTTYRPPIYRKYGTYNTQISAASQLIKANVDFSSKKLFITEIGWSTAETDQGVTEFEQALNLKKSICDAKKNGISAIILYELRDDSDNMKDTEAGFGIFHHNWQPKLAVQAIADARSGKCD